MNPHGTKKLHECTVFHVSTLEMHPRSSLYITHTGEADSLSNKPPKISPEIEIFLSKSEMGLDLTPREAFFMQEVTEPHSVVAFPLSHLPRLREAELKVSTARCQASSLCRRPYLGLILARRHQTVVRRRRRKAGPLPLLRDLLSSAGNCKGHWRHVGEGGGGLRCSHRFHQPGRGNFSLLNRRFCVAALQTRSPPTLVRIRWIISSNSVWVIAAFSPPGWKSSSGGRRHSGGGGRQNRDLLRCFNRHHQFSGDSGQ